MSRMSHVTTTLNNTNSWPLTIGLPKRKVVSKISKPPFFSGYVSFTEGRWWFEPRFLGSNKQIQGNLWLYDQGLVKTHWFPLFLGRRSFTLSEGREAFASFPSLRPCHWLGAPCKPPEAPCRLRCVMSWLKGLKCDWQYPPTFIGFFMFFCIPRTWICG